MTETMTERVDRLNREADAFMRHEMESRSYELNIDYASVYGQARAELGKWSAEDRADQYARQLECCLGCYQHFALKDLESDHDLPIRRCGRNDRNNLLLLCRSCNASKHTKTFAEWLEVKV